MEGKGPKGGLVGRLAWIRSNLSPDYTLFNVLAALVGMAAALVAVGLQYLIDLFRELFRANSMDFPGDSPLHVIVPLVVLAPALGGLLVGLLVRFAANEARGHGVPEVIASVAERGGRIRKRVFLVKGLATALTIGSGGSTGREGPIVLMGSGIGSSIAQFLKLTPYQTKVLLSCGASGGISATFNTPIAAVFFPLELILGEFKTRSFIPIVVSSVFSNITRNSLLSALGNDERFVFGMAGMTLERPFLFGSVMEYLNYILLGAIAALVAVLFIKTLYSLEDRFASVRIHSVLKPAIGGIIVGLLGLIMLMLTDESTYIFGMGYEHLNAFMDGELDGIFGWGGLLALLCGLVVLKIVATSFTLGSGGSGGVFAPSLFIGGVMGGAFGMLMERFAPFDTGTPASYALVGMAAVFSGASRATITAIVIIFEMTGTYDIILPLMLSCVVSNGLVAFLYGESIYSMALKKKGIKPLMSLEADLLDTRSVKWAMNRYPQTVGPLMGLKAFSRMVERSLHNNFPVRDNGGRLIGVVGRGDLLAAPPGAMTISEIMRSDHPVLYPDDPLKLAMGRFASSEMPLIPVVDPGDRSRMLGIITEADIARAYRTMMGDGSERSDLVRVMMGKKHEGASSADGDQGSG